MVAFDSKPCLGSLMLMNDSTGVAFCANVIAITTTSSAARAAATAASTPARRAFSLRAATAALRAIAPRQSTAMRVAAPTRVSTASARAAFCRARFSLWQVFCDTNEAAAGFEGRPRRCTAYKAKWELIKPQSGPAAGRGSVRLV